MKTTTETDFARCISRFLINHLSGERNLSAQTVRSYSFALKLYVEHLDASDGIKPEHITLADVTAKGVRGFLMAMDARSSISPNTYNQRLSALKTFVRFAMLENPAFILEGQRILSIPSKRAEAHEIDYLEMDAMRALLAAPDQSTAGGRRDLAIMALLYDSGARVQELIDLKVKDVRLEKPEVVTLFGKGGKMRTVPIMEKTARIVESYMHDRGFFGQGSCGGLRLFNSPNRSQFTRPGISKMLKRNLSKAKELNPDILFPKDIHPHALRASKAIHLLESGVNIIIIRDFLGHVSVSTTQQYLRVNNEAKRKAISDAYPALGEASPTWREDYDLMELLKRMCS